MTIIKRIFQSQNYKSFNRIHRKADLVSMLQYLETQI